MSGHLVVAVLYEALRKFGRIDDSNRDQVARWVERRVRQLQGPETSVQPYEPKDFDAKAAALGREN